MAGLPGFSDGLSRTANGTYGIRLASEEAFRTYRAYQGLQKFMEGYLGPRLKIQWSEATEKTSDGETPEASSTSQSASLSRTQLIMKSRTAFRPVMGVQSLAFDIANIIDSLPTTEKGQMIGIFGKWGRGKTFFLQILKKYLRESRRCSFIPVEFHAWKYQDTPASWAYLFETLAYAYLGSKRGFRVFWYWLRLFWLRVNCFGLWPLIQLVVSMALTVAIPWVAYVFLDSDQEYFLWGIVPATVLLSSGLLRKFQDQYSTRAVNLVKMYGTKNNFKASMGIQADIQEEIIKLLKLWTYSSKGRKKKIALVVEDIDRCSYDKIMPNIDALRVMLEDDEISERMIIITAVDETVLRKAIEFKYSVLLKNEETDPLITEYLDKLFICAIKLGVLTASQKEEYLALLFEKDEQAVKPAINPLLRVAKARKEGKITMNDASTVERVKDNKRGPTADRESQVFTGSVATPQEEWKDMSDEEKKLIGKIVGSWDEATPRKISIFYYRYLLCKNILFYKYAEAGRPNPWANHLHIQAVLNLLFHFGNCHHPESIEKEAAKLKDLNSQPAALPGLEGCGVTDLADYRMLLEVLELVVAY
jgi:KAP family P-loop domain